MPDGASPAGFPLDQAGADKAARQGAKRLVGLKGQLGQRVRRGVGPPRYRAQGIPLSQGCAGLAQTLVHSSVMPILQLLDRAAEIL
jgi:hypothetical protein